VTTSTGNSPTETVNRIRAISNAAAVFSIPMIAPGTILATRVPTIVTRISVLIIDPPP
jgi:hypothetical protein